MTNGFNDVQCTFDILSNSAVAFYIDLTVYPQFRDPTYVTAHLEELISKHSGAKTAECKVQGELLTIIVYGTVNPVTITETTVTREN